MANPVMKWARDNMLAVSLFVGASAALSSCGKGNDPVPDVKPIPTPPETGGGTSGGTTGSGWTIITKGFVSNGGTIKTDANLVMNRVDFTNDNKGQFTTMNGGTAKTEWVNTSGAIIKKYDNYSYQVEFPNADKSNSTVANLADTAASAKKPYFKTTLDDATTKTRTIYYTFIQGQDPFVYVGSPVAVAPMIDVAKFNSLSAKSDQKILTP